LTPLPFPYYDASMPDNPLPPMRADDDERDMLRIRMRELLKRAFNFKENIWNDDEKFWAEAENHPLKYKSRFADMTNVFNKPWATKIMEADQARAAPRMTTDKLEELGLSDKEIEKLATVSDEDDALQK